MEISQDKLLRIIGANLLYLPEEAELAMDTDLVASGLDSMSLLNIIVALEQELAVVIPDDELSVEHFETPRTLEELLLSL